LRQTSAALLFLEIPQTHIFVSTARNITDSVL
jgi:hypothetical protein